MKAVIAVTHVALAAAVVCTPILKAQSGGQAIFEERCAGCHGPDGRGDTDVGKSIQAADLTSESVQKASNSDLEMIVKNGKKKMPAFQGKLGDDEIKSVVAYVKQLGKTK